MEFGTPKMPIQGEAARNENELSELEKAKKELEQLSEIEKTCVGAILADYETKMLLDKLQDKLNITMGEGNELEDILEEIRENSSTSAIAAERMLIIARDGKYEDGTAWEVERKLGHIARAFADANQK
ncbi:MAG: hypothetical protein ACD_56C00146G0001 [uncultured bacterium]|nr:MAG: hypothetical protein ACD_56C00146G0001 [uncultured bacterium]